MLVVKRCWCWSVFFALSVQSMILENPSFWKWLALVRQVKLFLGRDFLFLRDVF